MKTKKKPEKWALNQNFDCKRSYKALKRKYEKKHS